MSVIIFLIILLVLVLVHEFGHFYSAKKFGIRVDEFGFGFPPRLYGKKFGETEYTFNLLPFGGFVKIFGENPDDDNTHGVDSARSFVNKPRWQQAIVLFAGVFANFILAWLLFSIGFMSGFPTSVGSEVAGTELQNVNLVVLAVQPHSPAENAGLKTGDKIMYVERGGKTETILNPETLHSFIVESGSSELEMGYVRGSDKSVHITKIKPEIKSGEAVIGISMDQIGTAKWPVFKALKEGMNLTIFVTKNTALGLYKLVFDGIQGKGNLQSITGPVGMVGIVGDAYDFGLVYLLSFTALISINLAIINLIPFPALDGGRLLFLVIEKIKGSRLNPKVMNTANVVGFGVLVLLMLFVTYNDILKLF